MSADSPTRAGGDTVPATYMSYEIKPDDDAAEQRRKLYLGVISAGEQAYTLGAAIAELRKKMDELDRTVKYLHDNFHKYKNTWAVPTCCEARGPDEPSCHVCGAMTTGGKCRSCGTTLDCT